jgi:hypothetical protein
MSPLWRTIERKCESYTRLRGEFNEQAYVTKLGTLFQHSLLECSCVNENKWEKQSDLKISVFRDMTHYSPLKVNRCFEGTCRFLIQGWRISQTRNQCESRWQEEFFDPQSGLSDSVPRSQFRTSRIQSRNATKSTATFGEARSRYGLVLWKCKNYTVIEVWAIEWEAKVALMVQTVWGPIRTLERWINKTLLWRRAAGTQAPAQIKFCESI